MKNKLKIVLSLALCAIICSISPTYTKADTLDTETSETEIVNTEENLFTTEYEENINESESSIDALELQEEISSHNGEIINAPWSKVQNLDGVYTATGEMIRKTECGTIKFRMDIPFVFDDDFIYLECIKLDDMSTWGTMARAYSGYTANLYLPEGDYLLDFCRAASDQYGDYRIEPVTFSVIKGNAQILTVPLISIYPTNQEVEENESEIQELETSIAKENGYVKDMESVEEQMSQDVIAEQSPNTMPIWVKVVAIITLVLIILFGIGLAMYNKK